MKGKETREKPKVANKESINSAGILGFLKHWQIVNIYLALFDLFSANFAYFLALWLRFDFRYNSIPQPFLSAYLSFIPIYSIVIIIVFIPLRLYQSIWRFASLSELNRVALATLVSCSLHSFLITLIFIRMPIAYYLVGAILQFFATLGVRFSYRYFLMMKHLRSKSRSALKRVMVIGAGSAGRMLIKDINHQTEQSLEAVCIIDDNPNKEGRYIDGVPVVGDREQILNAVEKYQVDQIIVAIPSAPAKERKAIINIASRTDCEVKTLPGTLQIISGEVSLSNIKPVAIEDLLGREPVKVNNEEILEQLKGQVVMVTGGGGSIGSELCRQIAAHNPKLLIVFDIYENNAYDLQQELLYSEPDLNLEVLIGSVRDSKRMNYICHKYKPKIIFHAAAHKHVPLMEDSPLEAIKNNVLGTYITAKAAYNHGVSKFVLISTDKAVNPTNVMGASKRLCEIIVQSLDHVVKSRDFSTLDNSRLNQFLDQNTSGEIVEEAITEYVAVRFGNVLGSNGSVVPLFKKQIAHGGPVTVTHKEVIRYFMTIPEAVSLILQTTAFAHGGEIFILDMGEPVKIDDLAKNLIRLSGHTPGEDIEIVYTGLRPGEKLFEEKLMMEEGLNKTENDLIHIAKPVEPDDIFFRKLEAVVMDCSENCDVVKNLKMLVPTFHPKEEVLEEIVNEF